MKVLLAGLAAASLLGCGTQHTDQKTKKTQESTEINTVDQVDQRPATAPGLVVVKVKEDANGEVMNGAANVEFRTSAASASSLSADNIEGVFAASQSQDLNSDSLDANSSEGQWFWGWRNRWARNYYYWGAGGYYNYRPYYYWGGYGYGYRFYNNYSWGGYRYYCYW